MIGKLALLFCFITFPALAKDFGQYGTVYPIYETPAYKLIEKRIQNISPEEKKRIESQFREKVKNSINRPIGKLLPRAEKDQSRLFNPSILIKEPIIDPTNGKVIVNSGHQVNPLDHVALNKALIFFDGCDEGQIKWIKDRYLDETLILVNGEPLKLQKQLNRRIYFDQKGKLINRFSIKALPTIINQEGKLLRIQECNLS
jgi:conjugal transfer pilus assembly protein TraW